MPIPLVLPKDVPTLPPPTSVETCLVEIIIVRMMLFGGSATYNRPAASSRAMPSGLLNLATLPTPSASPNRPHAPARVATARVVRAIVRMTWFCVSATYRVVSVLSTASRRGVRNVAAVPIPFVQDLVPTVPAIVETAPVLVLMTRTTSFPPSTIYTVSAVALVATPRMLNICTLVPTPFAKPETPGRPATVDTMPGTHSGDGNWRVRVGVPLPVAVAVEVSVPVSDRVRVRVADEVPVLLRVTAADRVAVDETV